jgi:hypothetical protein
MPATGFTRPGLPCSGCGQQFSLFLSRDDLLKPAVNGPEDLPDLIQAKCTFCRTEATYPRSAIGILATLGNS